MPQSQLNNRNFGSVVVSLRSQTINDNDRTIEAVLSTESPVDMWDYQRGQVIPEILLASGVELPKSRQVPLLNSHQRSSIDDQLGSIRNIATDNGEIVGRLSFSKSAENEWQKVREGHVTDVSVGYEVKKKTYVADGQVRNFSGREITGPANVVTKWRLLEGSVTPIGADEMAKMRGYTGTAQTMKGFVMNEELRALLVSQGMPKDASEEDAQKWLVRHLSAKKEEETRQKPAENKETAKAESVDVRAAVEAALKAQREATRTFRKECDSLLEVADMADLKQRCYELDDIADVRKLIIDERAKRKNGEGEISIAPGPAQRDKHVAAIKTAIGLRTMQSINASQSVIDQQVPKEQRAAGHEHYRNASLFDMAKECVAMDGINTRGLTREQVAMAALGFYRQAGVRSDVGYHQTGNFANLTLDAVNKSMSVGYQEFPATWRGPMRQGTSVPDFKNKHSIRLGAIPNIPVWPGIDAPEKASFADAKESYAVECRSSIISFGYKLLVNDDMDALTRVPQMFGNAASRTVNAAAWAQITGNPTMSDSVALFATATGARKRTNLTTGAGAPSVSTVQTLTNLMMQMRGENTPEGNESDDVLSLMPRYIVGPGALKTTIEQLINSISDPASSNSGVYNNTRNLVPVIEPLLDASSTTAWYLFASTSQIDTVEVSFLQGQETPVVRDWVEDETLSQNFAVLQTFGVKALNHRGIQKHAGA